MFQLTYGLPPVLTTILSPQELTEDAPFSLAISATDPEAGPLIFSDDTSNFDITSTGPNTAEIVFTPDNTMVGSFIAVIIVRDSEDLVDAQAIEFIVNGLPTITNLADKNVTAGNQFFYDVDATDPEDGTNLIFTDNSPLFNIDINTGIIDFITNLGDVGQHSISITVNDSKDAQDNGTFVLYINDQPIMANINSSNATEDINFQLDISKFVTNSVGSLTYSDNTILFDIDTDTGLINFTPTQSMAGLHIINISVEDIYGLSDSKNWTLNITGKNDAPIFPNIPDQIVKIGSRLTLDINATDEEGDPFTYSDDTSLFDININTGLIDFLFSDIALVGTYNINITVNDSLGDSFSDVFTLDLISNLPPIFPKNFSLLLNPTSDSYVDLQFADTNYRGNEFLQVSDLLGSIKRSYIRFSLVDLPGINETTIFSSELDLTINSGIPGSNVSLFRVNDSWSILSITYNNQPNIDSNPEFSLNSLADEDIDKFNVTNVVSNWFNNTFLNNGFSVKMKNESGNSGTINYYSSEHSNNSKWPLLNISYYSIIPNQSLISGGTLVDVFDLDDFFFDPDGDNLTFGTSSTPNLNIVINSNNLVTISTIGSFTGDENVIFNGDDSVNSTNSNIVKIEVIPSDTPPSPSGGGGGGGSSQKIASLSIILDSSRESIDEGKIIEIPVIIKNTGEVNLNNIDLSLIVDKLGLNLKLTRSFISSLVIGASTPLTLIIDTSDASGDSYVISLNANTVSPTLKESAIFVLDVLGGEGVQILYVQDLLLNNPECLELQELVKKAEEQIKQSNFDEARSNIDVVIESCKSIIRAKEEPQIPSIPLLSKVLISLSIFTILIISTYLIISRVKLSKKNKKINKQ